MMIKLRLLCLVLLLALAACATPPPPVPAPALPSEIAEDARQQLDREIHAEAIAAKAVATGFARRQMERWRELATDRAETDFIPWFSSYLTQQWLTTKVAWYTLNSGEGDPSPEDRLAAYIQEQYYDRVLAPVAREVDPLTLPALATKRFSQELRLRLPPLPARHDLTEAQFDRRIKEIQAIRFATQQAPHASLYDIVHTDPIDSLPAYRALLHSIQEAGGKEGIGLSKNRISPVARRVSEKLMNRLAISGGASAASTLIGGVAGSVLSLGASALGFIWHEAKRQDIEIALRETLNDAMDDMWKVLMDSPDSAVTAGVYHLYERMEESLPQTLSQPIRLDAPPQGIPLPETTAPQAEAVEVETAEQIDDD